MMWNITVEPDRPQVTIRRMRIASWIIKAKNTQSEYVIFISFPLKQCLHESPSVLRYTYIRCLVISSVKNLSKTSFSNTDWNCSLRRQFFEMQRRIIVRKWLALRSNVLPPSSGLTNLENPISLIRFFYTRWLKYDRDWFVCKQSALSSSCATLREWSHNLHPPSCSG